VNNSGSKKRCISCISLLKAPSHYEGRVMMTHWKLQQILELQLFVSSCHLPVHQTLSTGVIVWFGRPHVLFEKIKQYGIAYPIPIEPSCS